MGSVCLARDIPVEEGGAVFRLMYRYSPLPLPMRAVLLSAPRQNLRNNLRKRIEMSDDAVGLIGLDGLVGITEGHGDDGDLRGLRGGDIGMRVPDHHRAACIAFGHRDRLREMARVGLAEGESVASADGCEALD